jgi:glucosylceramidase
MKKAPDGTVIWHCVGVVSVDPNGGKVTEEWDYAYLGHASKFVKRGARVVGVAPLGSVESVAFVNPDDSRILVAYNASTQEQKFQVEWHGKAFAAKVPARSAATFAW